MENQDQIKIHTQGHDQNQQLHHCHKCGWTFPNPHPSAKHRRAHKRVCGNIEGHKLLQSEGNGGNNSNNSLLAHSDDDHLSDDDHNKSTSSDPLERSNNEKGSGKSIRLEDEVFSDAVTEFSESGIGVGSGQGEEYALGSATSVEITTKNESNSTQNRELSDLVESVSMSTDKSQLLNLEIRKNTIDDSESVEEIVLIQKNGKEGSTIEEQVVLSDHGKDTAFNLDPFKRPETTKAEPTENEKDETVEVTSDVGIKDEGNTVNVKFDLIKEQDLDHHEDLIKDFKEHKGVKLQPVTTLMNSNVGPSEMEVFEQDIQFPNSGSLLERKEGNENLSALDRPEAVVKDFDESCAVPDKAEFNNTDKIKVDSTTGDIQFSSSSDIIERTDRKEDGKKVLNVLSEASGLYVVDHGEALVKNWEDQKEVELKDKEDGIKDLTYEDTYSSFDPSRLMNENSNFSSLDIPEVKKSILEEEGKDDRVKEVDVSEIKTVLIEKPIQDEVQKTGDASKDSSVVNFPEVSADDARIQAEDYVQKGETASGKSYSEDAVKLEFPGIEVDKGKEEVNVSEIKTMVKENLIQDKSQTLTDDCQTVFTFEELESRDNSEDSSMVKFPENVTQSSGEEGSIQEKDFVENGLRDSGKNDSEDTVDKLVLPGIESTDNEKGKDVISSLNGLDSSSAPDTEQGVKEQEVNRESLVSAQSDEVGHVNLVQKNTIEEDHRTEEENRTSVQTREFPEDDVRTSHEALKKEDDDNYSIVKEQIVASQIEVPVDVRGQGDSLRGNCGSLSEEEKANSEKEKPAPEAKHSSDKSDMFEPPSFMTLVVHGYGAHIGHHQNTEFGSEIQTTQTQKESSESASLLQAGWFPSVTHTAKNESPARKKNEAIISKAANWTTQKQQQQHTPLKSLLGEATAENKLKVGNKSPRESEALLIQKDKKEENDDGSLPVVEDDVSAKRAAGKEWDSPARYESDIKREKRKVKGRPYWTQFICCASVN